MYSLLLAVIYLIFISLGLPDSLLGSGWPTMQVAFGVPSSYAGSTFMPMVFGHLQQHIGIGIMPFYLLIFAVLNIGMLERTYLVLKNRKV